MQHATQQRDEMSTKVDTQKREIISIVNMQGKNMENKFDMLAARVSAVEREGKKKKEDAKGKKDDGGLQTPQGAPLRAMASGTPPLRTADAGPDPLFDNDAWAGWRRSSPSTSEHSPGFPASALAPSSELVPRSFIIKGWCKFRDPEKSLTRESARALGDRVLNLLIPESREMASLLEPLLQNSRIVLKISGTGDGGSNCSRVQLELSQQLSAHPIQVHGTSIFSQIEPSPAKRARNSVIARAYSVIETASTDSVLPHLRLDVRAGAAYYAPQPASGRGLIMLGGITSRMGWAWRDAALAKSCPDLDVTALHAATEAILCE